MSPAQLAMCLDGLALMGVRAPPPDWADAFLAAVLAKLLLFQVHALLSHAVMHVYQLPQAALKLV